MKLTPQAALDLVNADMNKALKMFKDPHLVDGMEVIVSKCVQKKLDALLQRGALDVKVQFSLQVDPKKGEYMAFLSGSF